jgi:regulator of sirC expression with transglutaminase-like and TPR domain
MSTTPGPKNPLRLETPSPLDYFTALVAEDEHIPLLEAAIAIAQDDHPDLDVQQVLFAVDLLAVKLRARIAHDAPALQRLRLLNRFFFQEMGFGGNINNYYEVGNSYLHEVLATRRGIPITLAVLYIEFAQHAGLVARGVSFPGHFLVKLRLPRGEVVVDPFVGQSLSRDELEERLGPYRQNRGLVGEFEAPLGLFLQSAPSRDILARMLRNLGEIHRAAGDMARRLAVQQRLVILLPQAWEERRDRGLILAELGGVDQAAKDLQSYLEHCGGADDAPAVRARLLELQRSGSPRLH